MEKDSFGHCVVLRPRQVSRFIEPSASRSHANHLVGQDRARIGARRSSRRDSNIGGYFVFYFLRRLPPVCSPNILSVLICSRCAPTVFLRLSSK